MAAEADRTWLYALGAVALVWFATRKADAATPGGGAAKADDPIVTFPPIDTSVDLTPLFCSPFDQYGGWSDGRKLAEATRLYVERWDFSPPTAFEEAITRRDPCLKRHIDAIVNAYPPFPGQSFKASELRALKLRQKESRAEKKEADKRAREDCQKTSKGTSGVIFTTAGGVAGGLLGGKVMEGASLGSRVGDDVGDMFSGIVC